MYAIRSYYAGSPEVVTNRFRRSGAFAVAGARTCLSHRSLAAFTRDFPAVFPFLAGIPSSLLHQKELRPRLDDLAFLHEDLLDLPCKMIRSWRWRGLGTGMTESSARV